MHRAVLKRLTGTLVGAFFWAPVASGIPAKATVRKVSARVTKLPTQRKGGAKPRVMESYPALVTEAGQEAPSEGLPEAVAAPATAVASKPAKLDERRVQRRTEVRKRAGAVRGPEAYDAVPAGLASALERRLELTRALIEDHGRAYDYRVHTIKELETIQVKLDAARAAAPQAPASVNEGASSATDYEAEEEVLLPYVEPTSGERLPPPPPPELW